MSDELFLTREEVHQLTGYKVRKKQIEWLARSGLKFWISGNGHPAVPRSEIEGEMSASKAKKSRPQVVLNLDKL